MKKLRGAMILASLGVPTAVFAEIDFKGFGSVVGGKAVEVKPGEQVLGYTDTWTFKRDSLMSLQMNADMGDGLGGTLQFMSRGSESFELGLEWAYLSYDINDSLSLNAGRMRTPFYRYSDFTEVRYSYNWVTPPARVYAFDFPGFDGLSLLYSNSLGSVDSTVQVIAGTLDGIARGERTQLYFEDMVGINWTGTWEWLTARAGYLQAQVDIPFARIEQVVQGYQDLGNGFKTLGAGFGLVGQNPQLPPALKSRAGYYATTFTFLGQAYLDAMPAVKVQNDPASFAGFGLSVDRDSLLVDAEWTQYEAEDSLREPVSAYYLTLGWRLGPTVVYGTLSREMGDPSKKAAYAVPELSQLALSLANETGLSAALAGSPQSAPLIPGAKELVGKASGLQQQIATTSIDIRNWNIGVRWDFHPSAAFKVSYENNEDRINQFEGGTIRTAIDFVF